MTSSNRPATGSTFKVGNYLVYVREFELLCVDLLETFPNDSLLVIDEIGRMELLSERFSKVIAGLLTTNRNLRIIATVPMKTTFDVIAKLKAHPNAQLFHLTKSNRDEVYPQVLQAALKLVK